MEAKKLMIMDWVSVIHNGKPKNVRISWLTPSEIAYEDGGEDVLKPESAFKPIPLTAEILEKNGFKQGGYAWRDDEWRYHNAEDDGIYVLQLIEGKFCLPIFYYQLEIIDSVHKLQHALRLCGLNELADNFKI